MIIKYISFLVGIIWSYSIIKTQSIFSKKAGIIFKIFISNISWLTLIAACYFGYKNFSIKLTIYGIIIGFFVTVYTLIIPFTIDSQLFSTSFIHEGLFGINLLKPYELFGLQIFEPVKIVWHCSNLVDYLV